MRDGWFCVLPDTLPRFDGKLGWLVFKAYCSLIFEFTSHDSIWHHERLKLMRARARYPLKRQSCI